METLKWQRDRLEKEKGQFERKTKAEEQATETHMKTEEAQREQILVLEDVKKEIQKNLKRKKPSFTRKNSKLKISKKPSKS